MYVYLSFLTLVYCSGMTEYFLKLCRLGRPIFLVSGDHLAL